MKHLALASLLLIAACASTPASDVAAMEASLAAADTSALIYVNLPTCGKAGVTGPCKSISIAQNIGAASTAAYTAVKAAEKSENQSDITKAQNAVTALQNIVATIAGAI